MRRRTVDHLDRRTYAFAGTATVTEEAFFEHGEILAGESPLPASRSYLLQLSGDGVEVLFPDGRPFVSLEMAARQSVDHLCGEDRYRGRILVGGPNRWMEFWRVHGPRKRYSSLTHFARTF